ncbi:MAG: hypothetical protein R3358_12085, partial [Woeseiaceae bacterium]|nr:hypothetical protein [Woeseiaceae bacterium]
MATRDAKVKLKADTSGYRRSMDRAAGSTRRVSVSLRGIGRAAGGALRSVAGLAVKMTAVGAAGAAVAGILAARKAYGLLAESIDLVGVQLEAERNLQSVLNNQRAAGVKIASDLADRLKKQASALQEVGTTGDEVTIRGQAQLATFRGLIPHIERASEVMLQLSEFTGQDAVNAANLLGKAAEGQIGALSRYGISLSDTAKKTKDIGLILEEVSSQLPTLGVSASTARGRLAQLGNQVGDLKEQIGEALTPAIKGAVAAVRPMVGRMQEWVAANREWLQTKFNDGLRMAGAAVGEIASRVAGFINSGGLAAMAEGFRLVVDWIKAGAAGLRTMIAV